MSFPDPVVVLVAFVKSLTTVKVGSSLPPEYSYAVPFVVVEDGGGPGSVNQVLDQRRIIFKIHAPTRREASELTEFIRKSLQDSHGDGWYWVADSAAPAFVPDDAKKPRYQYTARVNLKRA